MSGAKPQANLIDYKTFLSDASTIEELQQWFSLNDMSEEGSITLDDAQKIAEQQDVRCAPEEIREVLAQVDDGEGRISLSGFCCFWAIITNAQKKINYREYLDDQDVSRFRAMFEEAAGETKQLTRKEVSDVLKEKGLVRTRKHVTRLFDESGFDKNATLDDFTQLCILLVKLQKRRKQRSLTPQTTCSCADLYAEGFTVEELVMTCGFTLRDFEQMRLPAKKLSGGFSALELRKAGYSAGDLRRAGMGLIELRTCGFSLSQLRTAGFSAAGLAEANRTMHSCFSVGDFTLLPQIGKSSLVSWSTATKDVLAAQRATMTPLIREHTDGRHKIRSPFSKSLPSFQEKRLPVPK
ncbi:unnamed protein product [Effrenium voratum]|nr:unnamed protein product [Effrenium voratum]